MDRAEVSELRAAFAASALLVRGRPRRCYFAGAVDGRPCEGRLQACHFIKRQRVEKVVADALGVGRGLLGKRFVTATATQMEALDFVLLASWDPRNAVPGCEAHHTRFDGQRMPPLVVPRHLVPTEVAEFCADWGLETALEDRCPPRKGE